MTSRDAEGSSSSFRAVCLVRGSINVDEFYHLSHIVKPGQTISASSTTRRLGGKGCNQACAAAKAGVKVLLDGAVGAGSEGTAVIKELSEVGSGDGKGLIDCSRIRQEEGYVTGKAVIQLAEDGENSIIILAGANFSSSPKYEPLIPPAATHLILANEIPIESTLTYLREAKANGVVTIYNPSPMPSAGQVKQFPWECLDWLVVNEGELEEILSVLTDKPSSQRSEDATTQTATKSITELQAALGGRINLICTLGSNGIVYLRVAAQGAQSMKPSHLPAAPLRKPLKDTTGAGDCFLGYLAAGLMHFAEQSGNAVELTQQAFEQILKRCLTKWTNASGRPNDALPNTAAGGISVT